MSGDSRAFGEWATEAKLEQAGGTFRPELERLARELGNEARVDDLVQAVSSLPVYRTYVEPWSGRVEDADRAAVGEATIPDDIARKLLLEDEARRSLSPAFSRRRRRSWPKASRTRRSTATADFWR